jgi:hypothetical protein
MDAIAELEREVTVDFQSYLKRIVESHVDDWLAVHRPVFLQDHQFGTASGVSGVLNIEEHHAVYTLKDDLSISIATGLPWDSDREFHEDWAKDFPDSRATADFVDLCWSGRPIHRAIRVIVDGGRAGLPVPRHGTLDIPFTQNALFRLIDHLGGASEYDRYFNRAGFTEVNEPWPR